MAVVSEPQHDGHDALRRLVDLDSPNWLLREEVFKNWLNPDPSKPPFILRLEGEPGTGKTYMTSDIVRQLQTISHTSFAFISYKDHSSTTALSVIHALTFSLASCSNDLQSIVRGSFSKKYRTTLRGATSFLIELIECTDPTFLIVDGLHEMDEVQRGRLASELVAIQRSTSNARILISCRPEPSLLKIIGRYSIDLQIEERNSRRIRAFVYKWAESWFAERCFGREEKADIELYLDQMVLKSRGVFSYAKIALDSLKLLYDSRDTRKEFGEIKSGSESESDSRGDSGNKDQPKVVFRSWTKRERIDSVLPAELRRGKRARLENVAKQDEQTVEEDIENIVRIKDMRVEAKLEVSGSPASNDDNDDKNSSGQSIGASNPGKEIDPIAATDLQARRLEINVYRQLAAARQSLCSKLPGSLNEAYGEILHIINHFGDRGSIEDARLILGWIGCSPQALTVQEIQQLLAINLEAPSQLGAVRKKLDLARICGPLVEVVDDYVYFVHFTAKEYIFSDRAPGFIDLQKATLDLTLRCITYLCQDHHNLSLSDEQVSDNVISGAYTLDWFATNMWPQLAKTYLNSAERDELQSQLGLRLDLLYSTRGQLELGYADDSTLNSSTFKETYPRAHSLICLALRFQEICTTYEYKYLICQDDPWTRLDPLTTCQSSVRIYKAVECLLAENEEYESYFLEKWYSQQPYKCPYLSCPFGRTGFQNEEQRLSHIELHNCPWRCSLPECEFSQRGFISEKEAYDHTRAHPGPSRREFTFTSLPTGESGPEFLLSMAQTGSVSELSDLLHLIPDEESDTMYDAHWKIKMYEAAVMRGSLPMLKLCLSKFRAGPQTGVGLPFKTAVETDNIEMLKYLLTSISEDHDDTLKLMLGIGLAIKSQVYEAIDAFSDFIKARPWDQAQEDGNLSFYWVLRHYDLVELTENDRARENLLIDLWRSIIWGKSVTEQDKAHFYSELLINVAKKTCSVALSEFLLKSGAIVDYRDHTSRTALGYAVKAIGEEARNLTKYLLDHGADNNFYPDEF
ncbi:hypothetical protein GGR51DRAFT_559592 [Nemania sp. FL0031]|nr:hypothetical protein GGR51DRAFT_559592 [Nemania sp. FL0031]